MRIGGSETFKDLRLQTQEPGGPPHSEGAILLQGSGGCCLPQAFPRGPGGSWGRRGLGRDGRQQARESAWRERKQVAEASLPACWPCPRPLPGNSPQSGRASPSGAQDGSAGLLHRPPLRQEVHEERGQGPARTVGYGLFCSQMPPEPSLGPDLSICGLDLSNRNSSLVCLPTHLLSHFFSAPSLCCEGLPDGHSLLALLRPSGVSLALLPSQK